jgi:hypothetical protein
MAELPAAGVNYRYSLLPLEASATNQSSTAEDTATILSLCSAKQ